MGEAWAVRGVPNLQYALSQVQNFDRHVDRLRRSLRLIDGSASSVPETIQEHNFAQV